MEGAVAGVAALRRTEDQLADLEQVNQEIGDLANNPDPAARSHGYRILNREFHATVHTMAHSDVIADISQRMWDLSDLLINTSGVPRPAGHGHRRAARRSRSDHRRAARR